MSERICRFLIRTWSPTWSQNRLLIPAFYTGEINFENNLSLPNEFESGSYTLKLVIEENKMGDFNLLSNRECNEVNDCYKEHFYTAFPYLTIEEVVELEIPNISLAIVGPTPDLSRPIANLPFQVAVTNNGEFDINDRILVTWRMQTSGFSGHIPKTEMINGLKKEKQLQYYSLGILLEVDIK